MEKETQSGLSITDAYCKNISSLQPSVRAIAES